jgi:MoaA/NifB/PqqE/SkfB family radical SAM enzyme
VPSERGHQLGSLHPYREAESPVRLLLKALKTRFWDQKPFILSHLLTGRCNANCQSCLWKLPAESRTDELTTQQVKNLYAEATAYGFRELVLWGGEPLLRPDAPGLLGFARAVGLGTTLITNGWALADRCAEVLPNTNRLILSLDAVGDLHDVIRGCPGLFRRIDAAVDVTLKHYRSTSVILICVVSKLNFNALEPLVNYAHERQLPLLFQHMNVEDYGAGSRSESAQRIALSATESREVSAQLCKLRSFGAKLKDSTSYLEGMGRNPFDYAQHGR